MEAKCLTEPLFFDNDCIAAFLWVEEQSILAQMYPGRIIIPKPVYDELSVPSVAHLRERIDAMILSGQAQIVSLLVDSEEYKLYWQMTQTPENGRKVIGNGEASCLALAIEKDGIIASNNLRDIRDYIQEYSLKHITTGDIMVEAYSAGLITEAQGNQIWANMLSKRRRIGANTFSEYLQNSEKPKH